MMVCWSIKDTRCLLRKNIYFALCFLIVCIAFMLYTKRRNISISAEERKYDRGKRNVMIPNRSESGPFIWPNRTVYYAFSTDITFARKEIIEAAMKHISSMTCIKFEPRQAIHLNWVIFTSDDDGCYANQLGMRAGLGSQIINLGNECDLRATIHEICHVLGFLHEFTRPDRDKYIKVLMDNIQDEEKKLFNKESPGFINSFGSYYDLISIMHYPIKNGASKTYLGFALRSMEIIQPSSPLNVVDRQVASLNVISYQDAYQIQRLYDCCSIPWNYNSTAKYLPYDRPERSLDSHQRNSEAHSTVMSNISLKLMQNVTKVFSKGNKRKSKNSIPVAHISILLAHSVCSDYSEYVKKKRLKSLKQHSLQIEKHKSHFMKSKTIRWTKFSSRLNSKFTSRQFRPREKKDPGEFGNHFQGDMYEYSQFDGNTNDQLWKKTIPYVFADHMNMTERRLVSRAMVEIQFKTCLKFISVPPTFGLHHVLISVNDVGCYSHVGFNSSRFTHRINLNRHGCLPHYGIILHEFLHLLGMHHENQKPTGNNYFRINLESMRLDRRSEFFARAGEHVNTRDFPVDFDSIMMLPSNVFASSPQFQTIIPLKPDPSYKMGQRKEMTAIDYAKLIQLYKCCVDYDAPAIS